MFVILVYFFAKIVKIKQNYVHHHVFHGHLILIEWLIVTGADSENLISVKRYDFDFQWRHSRYYVNVSTDHFQFRMDDEETIYSTEIQLEIGELKVVEEEIVYTWGKFKSSSAWPRYLTLQNLTLKSLRRINEWYGRSFWIFSWFEFVEDIHSNLGLLNENSFGKMDSSLANLQENRIQINSGHLQII